MSVPQKSTGYIEFEDYLALEAVSRYKHEYLRGVIYAIQGEPMRGMAGGSQAHARVIRNVAFSLHARLRGTPCEVLSTEMRLRVERADAMFYPDVLVHCQPNESQVDSPIETTELTDAKLVIEVLSPSTHRFDRGDKLAAYQQLPGLAHVLLLNSVRAEGWLSSRLADGSWSALQPWAKGSAMALPAIGVDLPWAEVWDGVGLAA